ncbi:MAG: 4-alpha-glucanotransferase [Verrucomicrobiales bacterium]|nr:4-alpha-glucanotransferase [Verrucomicrobiales bacterium]
MSEANDMKADRSAGILVPAFSIRTGDDIGIGDTEGVRQFIDFAAEQQFGFIQLLPINEIGPDNSPYNAISSVALEPLTIDCRPEVGLPDLDPEAYDRILTKHNAKGLSRGALDYPAIRALKRELLEESFQNFKGKVFGKGSPRAQDFLAFCHDEEDWLDNYCIYRFLMELENQNPNWQAWNSAYQTLEGGSAFLEKSIADGDELRAGYWMLFFAYVQWIARTQWKAVAAYGREKGVQLMGDIPIGISLASADVYADREIFDLNWFGGAPPERHFKDDEFVQKWGQNWGIPIYNWEALKKRDFDWWRQRVAKTVEICGMFRVDHALGFYRIYSFPWNPIRNDEFLPLSHEEAAARCDGKLPGFLPRDDDSHENKDANRREGEDYLTVLIEAAGGAEIIAEDLGMVPDYVRPSLAHLGIAGMKVPQWEFEDGSVVMGGHYPEISFAAYTTHDHASLKVQWNEQREIMLTAEAGTEEWNNARHFITTLLDFCSISITQFDEFPKYDRNFLDALFWTISLSNSNRIALMVTDLIYSDGRVNVPGVMSDKNWTYRLPVTVAELREGSEWEWMRDMSKNILNETGRAIKVG